MLYKCDCLYIKKRTAITKNHIIVLTVSLPTPFLWVGYVLTFSVIFDIINGKDRQVSSKFRKQNAKEKF